MAQDSTSKSACQPGDAVSPWATNEQSNRYVVDLVNVTTSWGNTFGLAPITKVGKVSSTFLNGAMSAQAISRTQVQNVPIGGPYSVWTTAGFGINDDPMLNDVPNTVSPTANGNQLAAAFAEYGATDNFANHSGIVTSLIRYIPGQSTRLYVERIMSAVAGCADDSQFATFGLGSVTDGGHTTFRSDSFGTAGGGASCPLASFSPLSGQNVFLVDAAARNTAQLNVMNAAPGMPTTPGGSYDTPATQWVVQNSATTHNTPSIGYVGGTPTVIGSNFNNEYVHGATTGSGVGTTSHLAAGVTGHRGNASRLEQNHPALSSTNGLAAILGVTSGGTNTMNVWGLDGAGNVTGTLGLTPPATITDNLTGATNLMGTNLFDHYHSQVAFNGGNGQVAMNVDAQGNLLVCAVMDQPTDTGSFHNLHHIPMARVTPTGSVTWTMAAYNDSSIGAQQILDGSGAPIGQLTTLSNVTGGTIVGPSFSAPMIDSAGNVWFVSAIELYSGRLTTGLLRAVYDPVLFAYQLELILANGMVLTGANSGTQYQIQFIPIADSNSVDSSTPFSGNICEQGYNGQEHTGVPTSSTLNLGGLVFTAGITYDVDGDGDFDTCRNDPASSDQDYNVMMYLGSVQDCGLDLGFEGPGNARLTVCGQGFAAGETGTMQVTDAPANTPIVIAYSFPGQANLPILGGTLVSAFGYITSQNAGTNAQGVYAQSIPGQPFLASVVAQVVTLDPSTPQGFGFTNAVLTTFGQ